MLQGFTRSKLTRLVRSARHSPIEDLMTASILGGLAYMPIDWALLAIKSTFCNFYRDGAPLNWPREANQFSVTLWPRYGGIEPDMLITINYGQGCIYRVLVEVKWDSPFHENQAITQWQLLNDPDAIHVLLVRRPEIAEQHVRACEKNQCESSWSSSLRILTWKQVARNLTQLKRSLPANEQWSPLRAWSGDAAATLDRFGEHCFQGIVEHPELNNIPIMQSPIFYADFMNISWPLVSVEDIDHWTPARNL